MRSEHEMLRMTPVQRFVSSSFKPFSLLPFYLYPMALVELPFGGLVFVLLLLVPGIFLCLLLYKAWMKGGSIEERQQPKNISLVPRRPSGFPRLRGATLGPTIKRLPIVRADLCQCLCGSCRSICIAPSPSFTPLPSPLIFIIFGTHLLLTSYAHHFLFTNRIHMV